jgi:hypothetical protein
MCKRLILAELIDISLGSLQSRITEENSRKRIAVCSLRHTAAVGGGHFIRAETIQISVPIDRRYLYTHLFYVESYSKENK